MVVLDALCARINPLLMLVAIGVALLNLAVAAQRWTVTQPAASLSVGSVAPAMPAEGCFPILAPELRDMLGHD